jgi:hypothetical protein
MCGLIGLIARTNGGFTHSDMTAFEQMMIVNTLRGKDSVGAFTKFGNGDVQAIKHGSNPFNLMRTEEWKDFRQKVINRGRFIIGHNRAATIGAVTTENAHPFVEGHIILVHNGTLRSQNNLTKATTVVDSHAICHALAEEEGDPRRVLDKIDGAFALIWYDSKKDRLFAARNDERPLVILEAERHFALSSEAWIAGYPMGKNNLDVKGMEVIKPNEMYEFGHHGKFEIKPFNNQKKTYGHNVHQQHKFYSPYDEEPEDDAPFDQASSVTPETKALREQLAKQASQKSSSSIVTAPTLPKKATTSTKETPPSTVCALTAPVGGTGGHTQVETKTPTLSDEERAQRNESGITLDSGDFPRGHMVIAKIITITTLINGRHRWSGTVLTPGSEMVDCRGFLDRTVTAAETKEWFNKLVVGKVQWCTVTINGGLTVNLNECREATMHGVHRTDMPIMFWDYAVNECDCVRCGRKVEAWEAKFTSLKHKGLIGTTKSGKPLNTVEVVCGDCLLRAIPKGEYHDDFSKKFNGARNAITRACDFRKAREAEAQAANAAGNAPVQAGESVSESSGGGTGKTSGVSGTPTLH